jgi:hypothetical protein
MSNKRPLRIEAGGHIFVFSWDKIAPELLHIYARHMTQPEDAIDVFFKGKRCWNEQHARWHSEFEGLELLWFWINKKRRIVQVISCARVRSK